MKLRTLASALITAGLCMGATQVSADGAPGTGPLPNLTLAEKSAFAMLESLFSATAAAIEANVGGCAAMSGFHGVSATAFSNGTGSARVDHVNVDAAIRESSVRGDIFNVVQNPNAGDINLVMVDSYNGTYGYDSSGGIMWGKADLNVNMDPYDEHIIKDFWTPPVACVTSTINRCPYVVSDEGLEVITKLDYPRSKWYQWSDYTREDGVEGAIAWTKTQIAPYGGDLCQMLFTGQADLQGHGFQLIGGLLQIQAVAADAWP